MCGIGGILNLENKAVDIRRGALILSKKLKHRGPDDEGFLFFDEKKQVCAFGDDTQAEAKSKNFNFLAHTAATAVDNSFTGVLMHRRLSIIDTGAGGHQPMCNASENNWITYNGEIYNYIELRTELEALGYRFRTQSDTEVLLNAYAQWGCNCLKKLNGMFAFALWDKAQKKLFCARDRSGVKPFYYYFRNGIFAFASELKALRALPFVETSLNERALHHYLLHDALEYEPEGFLKNVFELFPSHYLVLDLQQKKAEIRKYFEIPVADNAISFDEKSFAKKCKEMQTLVTDAIVKRLRSDVPVGCCLSGGIDSSIIAGVIAGHNNNFNAFTAVFPNEKIDESRYAKEVADFTHARWHTVSPTADELLRDYEQMIYALDIPIWSTSTYAQFRVMGLAHAQNIKVVLDGQGGDELFAGYPHYFTTYVNELLKRKKLGEATSEIKALGNNFWLSYTRENVKRRLQYNSQKKYLNRDFVSAHTGPGPLLHNFRSLNENLHYDFFTGRLKTYLRCEDRCSMHHSVESRTPFADDTALMQNAFELPAAYKIHQGISKYILRESMRNFMPASILARRDKMGFVTPHNRWLASLLAKYPDMHENPALKPYFNRRFSNHLSHLSRKTSHLPNGISSREERLAFKALTFSMWYTSFGF